VGAPLLPVVEYSITVPVAVDRAFRAFQNFDRLLHRGIYEEAVWTEGSPWQVGSRIRYTITQPIPATVAAVVTAISAPRSVHLLNHALGVTAEQYVSFGPDLRGGTRIRMTMTLVGQSTVLSDDDLVRAIEFVTHDALDSVATLCRGDSAAASQ
jgi:hypothetical protein